MLIDSHCHLDDYEDLPEVLARARAAGVETLLAIGIGDGPATMHHALEIATTPHADAPRIFADIMGFRWRRLNGEMAREPASRE